LLAGGVDVGLAATARVGDARHAGSLPEFNYSDAMENSRIIWTEDTLDTYLASPFMMLGSGINMTVHGIRDDKQREDLIEYLKHAR
jgi:cytochrome c